MSLLSHAGLPLLNSGMHVFIVKITSTNAKGAGASRRPARCYSGPRRRRRRARGGLKRPLSRTAALPPLADGQARCSLARRCTGCCTAAAAACTGRRIRPTCGWEAWLCRASTRPSRWMSPERCAPSVASATVVCTTAASRRAPCWCPAPPTPSTDSPPRARAQHRPSRGSSGPC